MSNTQESIEKKEKVGILRKRDTTALSSVSSTIKPALTNRPKSGSASGNKPSIKSADDGGGSMFSKRTKIPREKPTMAPVTRIPVRPSTIACHSTTTLDSRITATSQSSLSHKPGHLPSYLRNKPVSSSKNLVAVQMQCNKKQFNQIKTDLTEMQNKAIDYYKKYRESVVKLNKLNGQDEAPAIEELRIVNFSETSSDVAPSELKLADQISFNKLKQITNDGVLGEITEQVQSIQAPSFKLLQEFSNRLTEINNQMKSSENAESGDTNLFPKKIQHLSDEIEKKISEEEQEQKTRTGSFITNLKQVMINEEGTPLMMQNAIPDEYENFKKTSHLKVTELENKIKELELKKIHEEHKNVEQAKTIASEQLTIKELRSVVAQFDAKRDEKDNEIERLTQKLKQNELNNKRHEKLLESKANDVMIKDKSIVELKANAKSIQDKLTKITNQSQKMESKLARAGEESKIQLDQIKSKYEEETRICDQLRKELNDLNACIATDNKPLRDENDRLKLCEKALEKEIYSLKLNLTEMMHSKSLWEKSKGDEQVSRREMDRMEDEIKRMRTSIHELKDEVNNREIQLAKKTRDINDLEMLVKKLEQRDKVNEFKAEIMKLQDQNNQKTKENEQLQHDLNKTLGELRLQEESLFMQQRLLKIRSELIQSLQDNEDISKSHLSELNAEIDKKSYVVKQLNQEVSSKTEELENLFSTLGAKNLEVKRQDHIIKLLEETHERSQKVRVKQEEKISRLENENAELKRFVKYKG